MDGCQTDKRQLGQHGTRIGIGVRQDVRVIPHHFPLIGTYFFHAELCPCNSPYVSEFENMWKNRCLHMYICSYIYISFMKVGKPHSELKLDTEQNQGSQRRQIYYML